jgi:Fe-S-cluster-containing hydrogenase component 2
MATMITTDCINCGACEPECPNNAISQGETIFVIDPKLCTECVGFHDYEACAAVCPVDCCVTDPNNIESEAVLIARARELHPETPIGENFESRFRKGQGKSAGPAAAKATPSQIATQDAETNVAAPAATYAEPEVNFVPLPPVDAWNIPIRCLKCNETHAAPVGNFMIGNVIFCPHCHKSMVVRDNLNYHIRTLLKQSYEKWEREQNEFTARREREIAQFTEKRAKEAQAFESHQRQELERIREQLKVIGDTYDAPGRPVKRGARFGWG